MLPRVDNAVPAVDAANASTAIASAKQGTLSSLSQSQVGNQMQGEVLSRLSDSTFVVRVADLTVRMALPPDSQIGDKLQLTLLSASPRTVFQLNNGTQTTATPTESPQSVLEAALQQVAARSSNGNSTFSDDGQLSARTGLNKTSTADQIAQINGNQQVADLNEPANSSAPTQFSLAARLINQALQIGSGGQTNIVGKTALIPENSNFPDTATLADTLKNAISSSGLFYESHVAQWADGKYSLPSLQQEPQSSFQAAGSNLLQSAVQMHADAAQMMNSQLTTMEQNRVVWHGHLFPNQKMEWEISRDNSQKSTSNSDDESDQNWQSIVSFELPNLGRVAATINLRANHMQIFMRASNPEIIKDLQQHAPKLAEALQSAGAQLDSIAIKPANEAK